MTNQENGLRASRDTAECAYLREISLEFREMVEGICDGCRDGPPGHCLVDNLRRRLGEIVIGP